MLVAVLFVSAKAYSGPEVQQATSTWLVCGVEQVGGIE